MLGSALGKALLGKYSTLVAALVPTVGEVKPIRISCAVLNRLKNIFAMRNGLA